MSSLSPRSSLYINNKNILHPTKSLNPSILSIQFLNQSNTIAYILNHFIDLLYRYIVWTLSRILIELNIFTKSCIIYRKPFQLSWTSYFMCLAAVCQLSTFFFSYISTFQPMLRLNKLNNYCTVGKVKKIIYQIIVMPTFFLMY